ncbi:MAG: MFS transporter [Alphaproteobacteria bacterium]|nr:MFS transporter [Alphaproteobacteria bacterium]
MTAPAFDRRAVFAWCLFDWANSAFPAVITTFVFATYVTQAVAPDPVSGATAWAGATTIAGFAIALLSPLLGAFADSSGRQKLWLAASASTMAVATTALWFVRPEPASLSLALAAFTIATVAFEVSIVFYNALLPGLAPATHTGRVSGWGWGLGYAGGIVCLAVMLVLFVLPERPWLGLDKAMAEHVRIAGPLTAAWLVLFAAPLFLFVADPPARRRAAATAGGWRDLLDTFRLLRRDHRALAWFLVANMIWSNGLTTLFGFGAIYAAGTFGMSTQEVLLFGIALNVTAGLGAFGFAWVDDFLGSKPTIAIGLAALIVVGAALLVVDSKSTFWILALAIGPFLGPVQAAGRTLCARLAPEDRRAQVFGLYALSGRVTAFLGPMALGAVTAATQSQRWGMATILPFFAVGLWLLLSKLPGRV